MSGPGLTEDAFYGFGLGHCAEELWGDFHGMALEVGCRYCAARCMGADES